MEIGVFAFIKNDESKILLVRDATREQKWTLPGGGLEFEEIVTDGIKREVLEELGINTEVNQLVGIFSQKKSPGIVILFDCSILTNEFALDPKEVSEARYFSSEELKSMESQIKPAQFSMIKQRLSAKELPIFNHFNLK